MSKAKATPAKNVETVKVDPRREATLRNKVRKLEKHVRLFPGDTAAAEDLKRIKAGNAGKARVKPKEHGKNQIVKIQFRDSIDRLERKCDAAGNLYMKDGKPHSLYEDRISERVGVREVDYLQAKAKLKGFLGHVSRLKTPPVRKPYEITGRQITIGEALNDIIDPNIVNLAQDQGINLSKKPRDAQRDDGKPGRKITVAEALIHLINFVPPKPRRHYDNTAKPGVKHQDRKPKHSRPEMQKSRSEA